MTKAKIKRNQNIKNIGDSRIALTISNREIGSDGRTGILVDMVRI